MSLVKAFHDIDGSTGKRNSPNPQVFKLNGGEVPAIRGTKTRHSSEHGIVRPRLDPRVEGSESGGRPFAIKGGEDEEHPVGHGIGELGGVFGEEGGLGMEGTRRPWGTFLDGIEARCEPLISEIAQKGEIGRSPLVEAWCRFGVRGARFLAFSPMDVLYFEFGS